MNHFNLYSQYYDLLYGSKDYAGEAAYIHQLIQALNPSARSILELGSGTGIHSELLGKRGYKVFGVELSPEMVKIARGKGCDCMQGDISAFELERTFDVVIALFHVISYLTTNDKLVAAFKNAHRSLPSGGYFIFDTWYTPAVYHQKPENRLKQVENDEIAVWRFATPEIHNNKNVVDVNYKVIVKDKQASRMEDFAERHPMRHFTIPEIELLAWHTGFQLVKAEEFLTGSTPSGQTWGVCFILKKI